MKKIQSSINAFFKTTVLAAIVAGSFFTEAKAQCTSLQDAGNIRYGIRVLSTASPVQYEAYANPTGSGCQFIGASQFSLIVSDGASINIVNPNSSGVPGFTWTNNTNVISGGFKYAAIATSGSSGGAIPFNANNQTSLFIFTISGSCTAGVRIFINGTDPNSSALNGADFSNTFAEITPMNRETYTANISTTLQCPGVTLPLSLSNFAARAVSNKQVVLSWQTLNETNTKQFFVERSNKPLIVNSTEWQAAGTLAAAGTVSGSRSYQLIDNQPFSGVSYYRLRTVDVDGRQTYSDVKQINLDVRSLLASNVYPNPVEHGGALTLTTAETVRYRLLDKAGRLVQAGTFAQGTNQLRAPQSSGAYILEVTGTQDDSSKEHHRIIVQ